MRIDAIEAMGSSGLAAGSGVNGIGLGGAITHIQGEGAGAAPFSDLLTGAVDQVNALEDTAHQAVVGLMTGTGVDVHQAMIATEKANMAFELSLAIRNKVVGAYQQVMSMQF